MAGLIIEASRPMSNDNLRVVLVTAKHILNTLQSTCYLVLVQSKPQRFLHHVAASFERNNHDFPCIIYFNLSNAL